MMDKDLLRKWAQLREDAYEEAKLTGLSPADIAKKVGTSPSNVTNLIKRGSHTSPFSKKIDAILRETVPEYNTQLNDLLDAPTDALIEMGNLLMSQARLLRDPRQPEKFKLDTIEAVVGQLNSFRKTYDRFTDKEPDEG